ncbi:MAG: hypothetical protein IIB57_16245 [Planctomycetes bacterium]|nr:hypothetical protein [Planctomycetota bacterium]
MLRARFPMLMICFLFPVVCGTALAEPTLKLYDLRDLVATIPWSVELDRPVNSKSQLNSIYQAPPTARTPQETREDRIKGFFENLVYGMDLDYEMWLPGIYSVQAEEAQHAKFRQMLNQFRALFESRYEVEIVQYTIEMADVPSIGDEVSPASFVRRQRLVTTRRTPTPVEMITRHTFVSGIDPVVATGAVGYAVETDQVDEGLRVSVLVGAGEEDEHTTSIHLFGNVRDVRMGKMSGLLEDDRSPLQVELPMVRSRSIQSNLRIPFGKLTVLAVTAGFDGNDSIVIAAMVRKLDE